MTWLQTFILLILVFIIACLINIGINYSLRDQLKKRSTDGGIAGGADDSAANELTTCSQEINEIAGGREKVISLKILDKMTPYLNEVKSTDDVEEYLIKYFEYPKKDLKELEDNLSTKAPKKYRFLHTLIEDIVHRNGMESPEQFFKKSKLSYKEFLPKKTRRLLSDAKRLGKVTVKDLKKVSKLLDNYLSEEGTYLTKSKLENEAENLVRGNKVFKLKADKANMLPSKLESLIDKDPSKVFELDWLGMIPAMHALAVKKRTRTKEDDLKRQLEKDVETLELFRKYPDSGAYTPLTVRDLARRIEKASGLLYGPRYTSSLLEDLYRDKAYLDRYSAQSDARRARTERDTERTRREQAERERAQEQQARRTAQQQQVQADQALAERLSREQDLERERDEAREHAQREEVRRQALEMERRDPVMEIPQGVPPPPPGVQADAWVEAQQEGDADMLEALRESALGRGEQSVDEIYQRILKEKKDNITEDSILTDDELDSLN
jgi:hypothetical protein